MMIAYGRITLPDGRQCDVIERGTYEFDTNAWVPSDEGFTLTERATGEEFTPEELNQEITVNGRTYYLHEYVSEHATWQMEYEED